MKKDFLQEINLMGFSARMKRISDILIYSTREHYKNKQLEIEPNWHLIFFFLIKEGQLIVTEIASILQFSHPRVIKLLKKMKENGFEIIGITPKGFNHQKLGPVDTFIMFREAID